MSVLHLYIILTGYLLVRHDTLEWTADHATIHIYPVCQETQIPMIFRKNVAKTDRLSMIFGRDVRCSFAYWTVHEKCDRG